MPTSPARRSPSRGTIKRITIAWLDAITTPTAAKEAPIIASDQPNLSFV